MLPGRLKVTRQFLKKVQSNGAGGTPQLKMLMRAIKYGVGWIVASERASKGKLILWEPRLLDPRPSATTHSTDSPSLTSPARFPFCGSTTRFPRAPLGSADRKLTPQHFARAARLSFHPNGRYRTAAPAAAERAPLTERCVFWPWSDPQETRATFNKTLLTETNTLNKFIFSCTR